MQIRQKVAVVTGGARGLGKLYAKTLLEKGAKVAVLDILEDKGKETCEEFKKKFGAESSIFVTCDISEKQQFQSALEQVVKEFGCIDILINNAGILGIREEEYARTIAVNLVGAINGTLLGAEHMNKNSGGRGGVIINISSLLGLEVMPCLPAYHASKHGIIGFSRSYARMLGEAQNSSGVRLNVLAPSTVKSDMTEHHSGDNFNIDPEIFIKYGGFNEPSDVAAAVVKAIEEETLHGAVMVVHSGQIDFHAPANLQGTSEVIVKGH